MALFESRVAAPDSLGVYSRRRDSLSDAAALAEGLLPAPGSLKRTVMLVRGGVRGGGVPLTFEAVANCPSCRSWTAAAAWLCSILAWARGRISADGIVKKNVTGVASRVANVRG